MSCQTNSNEFLNNALDALSNRISSLKSDVTTLQQNQIASNNLAVYLQNFTVTSDLLQNNWNTVGVIPSNITYRRVWEFSSSFNITSSSQDYTIVYDFSNVVSNYTVTFEGAPSGTISIGNQVFNANEYCKITQQGDILYFNLNGLPSGIKVGSQLSYIINFNDYATINLSWANTTNPMVSSNGPNSVTWYGVNTTTAGNQPTYSIYLTNWTLVNGNDNPYYQWYFDDTWFTNNSTYFNNLISNQTAGGVIITFINTSGQNLPNNSVQFNCEYYTTNDVTYGLEYLYNDYIMYCQTANNNSYTFEYQPYFLSCSSTNVCEAWS